MGVIHRLGFWSISGGTISGGAFFLNFPIFLREVVMTEINGWQSWSRAALQMALWIMPIKLKQGGDKYEHK